MLTAEEIAISALTALKRGNSHGEAKPKKEGGKMVSKTPVVVAARHGTTDSPTVASSVGPRSEDFSVATSDSSTVSPDSTSFPIKLYEVLSHPRFENAIQWMPQGRSFRVTDQTMFALKVCPLYFGHSCYKTFVTELENHGFKELSPGTGRGGFFHECMVRNKPHLLKHIAKDAGLSGGDTKRASLQPPSIAAQQESIYQTQGIQGIADVSSLLTAAPPAKRRALLDPLTGAAVSQGLVNNNAANNILETLALQQMGLGVTPAVAASVPAYSPTGDQVLQELLASAVLQQQQQQQQQQKALEDQIMLQQMVDGAIMSDLLRGNQSYFR